MLFLFYNLTKYYINHWNVNVKQKRKMKMNVLEELDKSKALKKKELLKIEVWEEKLKKAREKLVKI